jgi:hypothetical protein
LLQFTTIKPYTVCLTSIDYYATDGSIVHLLHQAFAYGAMDIEFGPIGAFVARVIEDKSEEFWVNTVDAVPFGIDGNIEVVLP